jgi:chloramphenicol 3-O phosphotransferase
MLRFMLYFVEPYLSLHEKPMMPGTIILLNGASSSGKTTLLKVLQEALPEPFLDAGLDRFLWMLPKTYLDRPLWDDVLGLATQAGRTGLRLVSGMHHAIAALSLNGNHVLADHVLVEPGWLEECIDLFYELPAFLVGVRCPLAVLEQRERARKDRTLGQARAQFGVLHRHGLYDIEVDTSLYGPQECAQKIIDRLQDGRGPFALRQLKQTGTGIDEQHARS